MDAHLKNSIWEYKDSGKVKRLLHYSITIIDNIIINNLLGYLSLFKNLGIKSTRKYELDNENWLNVFMN